MLCKVFFFHKTLKESITAFMAKDAHTTRPHFSKTKGKKNYVVMKKYGTITIDKRKLKNVYETLHSNNYSININFFSKKLI